MKVVVKIGGSLMKEGVPDKLISDVAVLSHSHQLVMVHGGGDVVTEMANRLGKEQKFIVSPEGIRSRYTDFETVEIYQMVMSGMLAKRLVVALAKAGVKGISVSGIDGGLLQGRRKKKLVVIDERGRKVAIDGGFTGKVTSVNVELMDSLLSKGFVPVISPVALSEDSEPLNIDGDRAASSIASSMGADGILFATNVEGLSLDGRLVPRLTPSEVTASLPKIGFGMQKKVMAAAEAVEGGVKEGVICSGTRDSPITRGLAHEGCTVVAL
jgi:[amino group carrier protein]-L-2-aminoadipate/L-glutamate 6-kinase